MIDRALDAWRAQRTIVGRPARVIIQIITAMAYMAAYLGLREASNDQWYLPAGLRFAALLVAPYRLWPALFLGDVAALATFRVGMMAEYGWAYYLVSSVAAWPIVASIVHQVRRTTGLPKIGRSSDAVALIVAGVLSAELVSLANKATSAYLKRGGGQMVYGDLFVYSIGHLQGILLASMGLALAFAWRGQGLGTARFRVEALWTVGACGVLGLTIGLLVPGDETALTALRLCLLLPCVALTFRHGWQGAAVGAIAGDIALFATIPHQAAGHFDSPALLMQEAFGFVASSLFVLGSRGYAHVSDPAAQSAGCTQDRGQAREHYEAEERRQRDTALRAEALHRDSRESMKPLVNLLRKSGQAEVAMSLIGMAKTQTSHFERSVIDSIYPLTLERLGLFAAIESDAFAARFGATPYTLDLTGSPHGMGLGTHLAVYRVLGEAVEHMTLCLPARISLRIHCGVRADGCGVVSMSLRAVAPSVPGRSSFQTARLAQLRNHVAAYGGSLHSRPQRMRMIVLDERMQSVPATVAVPVRSNVRMLHTAALSN